MQEIKAAWLQLAKLYKALGEEDVLRGLYAKIGQHPATKQAIEAEIISDYETAFNTYDSAVSKVSREEEEEEEEELATKQEVRILAILDSFALS